MSGESPLSICIKYGFENIAEFLIDKGADICGSELWVQTNLNSTFSYTDCERSPLQEAIRLSRTKIVEKMFQSTFERDEIFKSQAQASAFTNPTKV
jgi:hypothetical protein